MKTLAIFVFVVTVAVVSGSGVGIHASVTPGAVIVGGAGPWGWGGVGGLGGLGGWGGRWGPWNGVWGGWLGAGHDGQWIPDHTELLYDDGSYKPAHYGW